LGVLVKDEISGQSYLGIKKPLRLSTSLETALRVTHRIGSSVGTGAGFPDRGVRRRLACFYIFFAIIITVSSSLHTISISLKPAFFNIFI
jgi:hypothetical protein